MAAQMNFLSDPVPVSVNIESDSVDLSSFSSIPRKIIDNLRRVGIESFFPVQASVIPRLLEGSSRGCLMRSKQGTLPRDFCVSAPTGSGKTLAYVVPIVSALSSCPNHVLRCVVVVPSQALVEQVGGIFQEVGRGTGLAIQCTSGQVSLDTEQQLLVDCTALPPCGRVDVLISTPGRLVDHITRTPHFSLHHVRFLVVDEVDRLLDQTFQEWMERVSSARFSSSPLAFWETSHLSEYLLTSLKGISPALDQKLSSAVAPSSSSPPIQMVPRPPQHPAPHSVLAPILPFQKLLFSATLTESPEKLALLNLYQPLLFSASDHAPTRGESWYCLPPTLKERVVVCKTQDKPAVLVKLLQQKKLKRVLCFTNTKDSARLLCSYLADHASNLTVGEYSAFLSKAQQLKQVRDFNKRRKDVLVCSDAMARGMDLERVESVVGYDAPKTFKTYVHRVGRTARAGAPGAAYSLLQHDQVTTFSAMLKEHGKTVPQNMQLKLL